MTGGEGARSASELSGEDLNGCMRKLRGGPEEMKMMDLIFGHTEFEMPAEMWARNS